MTSLLHQLINLIILDTKTIAYSSVIKLLVINTKFLCKSLNIGTNIRLNIIKNVIENN